MKLHYRVRRFSDTLFDSIFVRAEGEPRSWRQELLHGVREIPKLIGVIFALFSVALLLYIVAIQLYVNGAPESFADSERMFIASLIIIAGISAHFFKQADQHWYGIVEILIGGVSSFAIAASMDPQHIDFARFASLVGSGYVIARGFGNRLEGLKKRSAEHQKARANALEDS